LNIKIIIRRHYDGKDGLGKSEETKERS